MKQVTFIHTADLHLDVPFSSLGDENKALTRRGELEACLSRIVQKVHNENINLLIISGDLFEDKYIKGSTILHIKNMFSELFNTEIIITPGNHDPISESSYYKSTAWSNNVHILEDSKQVLRIEKYNTCIYNMGIRESVRKDYSQLSVLELSEESFNILLFHGTVDMPFEEENYNSMTSRELFRLGMDYVALGHMHCYNELKNEKTLIVNPGSPEPLGFDEEGQHGFVQGVLQRTEENEKKAYIRFIPAAVRQYYNIEVKITGCATDTEVIEKITAQENYHFRSCDLYSITFTGFIKSSYVPDLGFIYEALRDKCFFIKLKNQTSIEFDYRQYLEDPGIKGEFIRRILDMQEGEGSQEKRETFFLAMQYGLQALENGRID